jgi:Mlc titration factor MtfA (ptsG expression regulator)
MFGLAGIGIIILIVVYTTRHTRMEKRFHKTVYSSRHDFVSFELEAGEQAALQFLIDTIDAEFPFYKTLSPNERMEFARRTWHIRQRKSFMGMEGQEVSPRHEIIISATLARLTFGLKRYYDLPKFELIQVYPREFYSRLLEQHVKGLTIGNGRLFLSWAHFEEGHHDPTDKIHVGLHEFAHAMMLEFNHFELIPQWQTWLKIATPVMIAVAESDDHFFRKYGATNIHEFWAVTVETFFEQPKEFNAHYPDRFRATCAMLNQWPFAQEGQASDAAAAS